MCNMFIFSALYLTKIGYPNLNLKILVEELGKPEYLGKKGEPTTISNHK